MDNIEINVTLSDYAAKIDELKQKLASLDKSSADYSKTLGDLERATGDLESATGELGSKIEETEQNTKDISNSLSSMGSALQAGVSDFGSAGMAISKFGSSMGVATGALKTFVKGWKALKVAMASNPIGLLITALAGLGVAIYNTIKSTKEAEKEFKEWKKTISDVDSATREYSQNNLIHAESLYKAAMRAKSGTDEYRNAILALQKEYPGYFDNLSTESKNIAALTNDYYRLRDAIVAAAQVKGIESTLDALYKEQAKLNADIVNMDIDSFYSKMKAGWAKGWSKLAGTKTEFEKAYERLQFVNSQITKNTEALVDAQIEAQKYRTPEVKGSVTGKGHSSSGHSSSGRGGSSKSTKEEKDEALAALEELADAYDDFDSAAQDNLSFTLSLIDQNIGAITDFENRAKGSFDETAEFEIQQLERRKLAEDKFYQTSSSAQVQYLKTLEQEEEKANADLLKGQEKNDQKLIKSATDRLSIISKEQEKVRRAQQLADQKAYNRQYTTSTEISDILQETEDEKTKKLTEQYNARLQTIQTAYDMELVLNQMRYDNEREREEADKKAQEEYLNQKLSNEMNYLYNLRTFLDENEPIIQAAKLRMLQANVDRNQIYKDNKIVKDHFKNIVTAASAIGDLTDTVANAWKRTVQAQLDAGELTEEEAAEQFERIKKMEIAAAVVNTIAGAIGAFMQDKKAYPAPYNYIIAVADAASTLAAGYAQIQQIKSTTIGGSGSGGGTNVITGAATPLLNEAQDMNTLNAMNVSTEQPDQRVYVVESDITDAQNRNKVRVSESTF